MRGNLCGCSVAGSGISRAESANLNLVLLPTPMGTRRRLRYVIVVVMHLAKRTTGLVLLALLSMMTSCTGGRDQQSAPTLVVHAEKPHPAPPQAGYRVQYDESPWVRDPWSTPDSLVIRVLGVDGMPNCSDFDHADVWETTATVKIRVYMRHLIPTADGFGCADVGTGVVRVRIPLPAPLGERSLLGDCQELLHVTPTPTWLSASACQALSSGPIGQG